MFRHFLLVTLVAACGSSSPTPAPVLAEPLPSEAPAEPAAAAAPAEAPPAAAEVAPAGSPQPGLLDPSLAQETAPAEYKVQFETTKGKFVVAVHRAWAPKGADRFYNLVKVGYYDDVAFFRAIDGFMVQFGIHGTPTVNGAWRDARLQDDPVSKSNTKGMVTFATSGPNSRTTQLFINYGDNANLDAMGFAPFGEVVDGMNIVNALHTGYGEGAPRGRGPDQGRMAQQGNAYLKESFPKLDYIQHATLLP